MGSRSRLFAGSLVAAAALLLGALASAPAEGSRGLTPLVVPNVIVGTSGHDVLTATDAVDVIYANSGNDTVRGVSHGDTVFAGSGNDTVELTIFGAVNGARLDLNVGHDTVTGIALFSSSVNAGSGNDLLEMSSGGCGNEFAGGSGNDRFETPGASCPVGDTLNMGTGNDVAISSRAGSFLGGPGHDRLTTWMLTAPVATGTGNDVVEVGAFGAAIDVPVSLGSGHDRMLLYPSSVGVRTSVSAGNGNDQVTGRFIDSDVIAGSGNDRITLTAFSAANDLDGLSGHDHARLDPTSTGTSCLRIELVTDLAGSPRACS